MTERALKEHFELREERFVHGGFAVGLLLPASPEALIDHAQFDADERLPYWAELWPSARALTRTLLELRELPGPALELGCGVGLPSLALRYRGLSVTATDYDADAVRFARVNAARNHLGPLPVQLLDWRTRKPDLPILELVVAADVLYEARNVQPLASLVDRIVAPTGSLVLADPGRRPLTAFRERMTSDGWLIDDLPSRFEPSPAGRSRLVRVCLLRLSRRNADQTPGPAARDGRPRVY